MNSPITGHSYAFDTIAISTNSGNFGIALDTVLADGATQLTLVVDGTTFAFVDADTKSTTARIWNSAGLSWPDGQEVSLSLRAPLPVVTIEALSEEVAFGVANAAQFRLRRTGAVDAPLRTVCLSAKHKPALNKTPLPCNSGFGTGERTDTFSHLVLDEDDNGDPICEVTFEVRPGTGYAVASPSEATVTVKGPGTTCETGGTGNLRIADPLTAGFEGFPPSHDGESPFSFRIAFSADITASAADLRDHALAVSGGTVTSVERVNQQADLWSVTVTPSGTGDVSILLEAGRACSEAGAICTALGGRLTTGLARLLLFAPPPEEPDPLTGGFEDVPETHDGENIFTFKLRFSEQPDISYRTLRNAAFAVTAGTVRRARRLEQGSNLRWEIHVKPASKADVTVVLPATADCDATGAICTEDGRALTSRLEATVKGPGSEAQGFPLAPENGRPSGIWSDGETAWVADIEDARLYAYRRPDGERQPERDIATGPAPMGLWSDGETLWAAGLGGGLRAHRLSDGARLPARDLALEANGAPAGIWSDGETAWVSDWLGGTVRAYLLADGKRQAGRDIELAGGNLLPVGVWSDGETLWVADWRERMYAYRLADGGRAKERDIAAGAADTDPTGLWSGGGTLLSTGWEDGEVRAFRLPSAPRAEDAPRAAGPGAGLPAITDPALRAAVGAALGKAPGETASQADLAGLESLKARNAGIRDLAGLEDAVSLKELDLGFNPLADLRPLAALPALKSLNLDGAGLDLRALASLAGLRRLSLRHNGIAELGALAPLAGLAELDVGDNRIEDLYPLVSLAGLKVLRADRNRIADLWPLASLAGLEALDLRANRARDLQPLAGLARLTTLRLGGNGLAELHPLSVLEGLQELGLAGNAVEDLRALSDLGGLRRLDLRGNPAGDLRPLRALRSLVWVHVGGSGIEDLAPLDGLEGLTVAGRDDLQPPDDFSGRARRVSRD